VATIAAEITLLESLLLISAPELVVGVIALRHPTLYLFLILFSSNWSSSSRLTCCAPKNHVFSNIFENP
jgi:hypothetical protein